MNLYSKRVLHQLSVEPSVRSQGQSNDREADGAAPLRQGAVLGRRRDQRPALARADAFKRRAETVAAPRLHLDDHERAATPADEVELAATGQEARADDLVAARPQEVGGRALAGST